MDNKAQLSIENKLQPLPPLDWLLALEAVATPSFSRCDSRTVYATIFP